MDENGDEPVVMTGLAGIPTSEAVPVYDNPGPDEPQEAPPAPPPVGLGIDLHLVPTGPHLRRGLTDALREAVRSGRLGPGTRLPSSRVLAVDLGIARNTVADAYADLVAEGWLTARQGSGTRVAERPVPQRETRGGGHRRAPGKPRYSLLPGSPDLAAFPRAEWLKAARRAFTAAPNDVLGYGDPRGLPELRAALAGYLARVRGVRTDPEHLLISTGFSHSLRLLGELLHARGVRTLAVESYGLPPHWAILERAGLTTTPLPFDTHGTRVENLPASAGAVLLTPSHQFPLGVALRPERRAEIVDWARRSGGLILEDDYDGEFRYDRQQVGALQDLAPDHVVYLGTASKSLAPGLRIAWLVLPPSLTAEAARLNGAQSTSALEQLTLAEFIESGAYDRHVRASRLRYRRRRDDLVTAVTTHAPDVRVTGIAAGLHAVLSLPPGTEDSVIHAAAWQSLALYGLTRFRHATLDTPRDALVVGYGTPSDHTWPAALAALCRVLP
ncbi:PLP-dependent aminotransferase family protein [Streptomyces acidiscabies]|uniref:PLP-dependent aminotransferase family protein n=7 Tax=Streptomyces acidiscabies TaxID=42234 RepID=A0AAP6EIW2_9ACTN|nr:PLP-dependent aminotransferase family protein [Streptomyces acidiscabies]MDX2964354.1 PLP-dependent aminotransferase family protein [Streptomyces acidiscabies]MDX3017175.1 PLP-dependent aminotransferase family protein [Streptomyces acidiscabies]MDX3789126.1 PLP-dependent aminotransferase family protein [Streptomyces acidiscabies]